MSSTLKAILKHWTAPLPPENELGFGTIDLPFNLEAFCRENDTKLRALEYIRDFKMDREVDEFLAYQLVKDAARNALKE